MTGVLAAVARALNLGSPTKSSKPLPCGRTKRKNGPGSSPTPAQSVTISNPKSLFFSDKPRQILRKASQPNFIRFPIDLGPDDITEDDSICYPHNCAHCRYTSPGLVNPSSSCPSFAVSIPNVLSSPFTSRAGSPLAGPNDGFHSPSSSPKGLTLSDGTSLFPLPELAEVTTSIAQRRGIKTLSTLRPSDNVSLTKTEFASLGPPSTPETASFVNAAQRIVGYMRLSPRASPTPSSDVDYHFDDPFGRHSPSYFPNPDSDGPTNLSDLSIYDPSSPTVQSTPDGTHYYTEKCPKHGKARLYIWVSGIDPPIPTTTAPTPTARPPPPPQKDPSRARSHAKLKPLILPRKLEIAEAQEAPISILSESAPSGSANPTQAPRNPKLRPLVLPQQLARRASHPPRRPITPSRSNTFPFASGSGSAQRLSGLVSAGAQAQGGEVQQLGNQVARQEDVRGDQQQQRLGGLSLQRLQLDRILSLLDESGVFGNSNEDSASLCDSPVLPESESEAGAGAGSSFSGPVLTFPSAASQTTLADNLSEAINDVTGSTEGALGQFGHRDVVQGLSLESIATVTQLNSGAYAYAL